MAKYRIVEHNQCCWEPQVLSWWWPFWRSIRCCTYTGYDWSPWAGVTKEEALEVIEEHKHQYVHKPPIHRIP